VYRARQTVSEKLVAVEQELPPGVNPPALGPQSSILGEIMIIGLTSAGGKINFSGRGSIKPFCNSFSCIEKLLCCLLPGAVQA